MSFEKVIDFYKKYQDRRKDQLKQGDRLHWSTSDQDDYAAFLELFDSESENQQWKTEHDKKPPKQAPDVNILMKWRVRIAWLCGNRRDLRTQFMVSKDDKQRTSVDSFRFASSMEKWAWNYIKRLEEADQQRGTPIG